MGIKSSKRKPKNDGFQKSDRKRHTMGGSRPKLKGDEILISSNDESMKDSFKTWIQQKNPGEKYCVVDAYDRFQVRVLHLQKPLPHDHNQTKDASFLILQIPNVITNIQKNVLILDDIQSFEKKLDESVNFSEWLGCSNLKEKGFQREQPVRHTFPKSRKKQIKEEEDIFAHVKPVEGRMCIASVNAKFLEHVFSYFQAQPDITQNLIDLNKKLITKEGLGKPGYYFDAEMVVLIGLANQRLLLVSDVEESQLGEAFNQATSEKARIFIILVGHANSEASFNRGDLLSDKLGQSFFRSQRSLKRLADGNRFISLCFTHSPEKLRLNENQMAAFINWIKQKKPKSSTDMETLTPSVDEMLAFQEETSREDAALEKLKSVPDDIAETEPSSLSSGVRLKYITNL